MAATRLATHYARATGMLLVLLGFAGYGARSSGYIGLFTPDFLLWDPAHDTVHILLGLLSLYVGLARRPLVSPRTFGKAFGALYAAAAGVGFVSPDALAPFGLHLETGENLLHLLLGATGLLAGFYVRQPKARELASPFAPAVEPESEAKPPDSAWARP
jgi:hypothetical protein